MKLFTKIFLIFCACSVLLTGCSESSKSKIINDFRKHGDVFERVAEYIRDYDYAPYEEMVGENEPIYGSFAISDFNVLDKEVMLIEGGQFMSISTFSQEVEIPQEIIADVKEIFNLGYAYISQVNALDTEQIIYFRADDILKDTDRPHGLLYCESNIETLNLPNDRILTDLIYLNGNWYYYEQESSYEYKSREAEA